MIHGSSSSIACRKVKFFLNDKRTDYCEQILKSLKAFRGLSNLMRYSLIPVPDIVH